VVSKASLSFSGARGGQISTDMTNYYLLQAPITMRMNNA
jgi:hypothetical protein